ncbi:MAG: PD-(D/E)XK nuclease family protein [Deltaproteobacteria bacterium]|nr:PD-(D/E)XK nuclease family protein [Deltaproteobacteria bacterium]
MNPISPSSLSLYLKCPALYRARYIDKEYAPFPNRLMMRGSRVHKLLEQELSGLGPEWGGETDVLANARPVIEQAEKLARAGFEMLVEHSVASDGKGTRTKWGGKATLVRSRIDLLLADRKSGKAVIVDWKTGTMQGDPLVQLAFNAMCLSPDFRGGTLDAEAHFVYVDSGRVDTFRVRGEPFDGRVLSASGAGGADAPARGPLKPHLLRLLAAHESGSFPAARGDRCASCDWKGCRHFPGSAGRGR